MAEINIPITYREDPAAYDEQTYTYTMSLGPDNQQDYLTGKLVGLQMEAIANSVATQLPQTAVIDNVNGHDISPNMNIGQFIESLKRHDDYFSVLLFNRPDVQTPSVQIIKDEQAPANQSVSVKSDESAQPNSAINLKENPAPVVPEKPEQEAITLKKNNDTEKSETMTETKEEKPNNGKLEVLHVQKAGHRSYNPVNISNNDYPDDDDYINYIGMSPIARTSWKTIKDIVIKNRDVIFDNPFLVLPDNASVTPLRKQKVAKDSGLTDDDLKDSTEENLGQFKNGTHYFKIIVFKLKQDTTENNVTYDTDLSNTEEENIVQENEQAASQDQPAETIAQSVTTSESVNNVSDNQDIKNIFESINKNNQSNINLVNTLIKGYNDSIQANKELTTKLQELRTKETQEHDFSDMPDEIKKLAEPTDPKERAHNLFNFLNDLMNTTDPTKPNVPYIQSLISDPIKFLKAVRYLGTID